MKTKIYIFLLILSATISSWAQSSINDYKYVSVAEKFDFLKSNDQYQLNSLTTFLLKKNGFFWWNVLNPQVQDFLQRKENVREKAGHDVLAVRIRGKLCKKSIQHSQSYYL